VTNLITKSKKIYRIGRSLKKIVELCIDRETGITKKVTPVVAFWLANSMPVSMPIISRYNMLILRYDLPSGFTYLQLGRDVINLFLFKYMPF